MEKSYLEEININGRSLSSSYKPGSISFSLGFAAFLVSLQSFLFGYIFSCLNSCLVLGEASDRKLFI